MSEVEGQEMRAPERGKAGGGERRPKERGNREQNGEEDLPRQSWSLISERHANLHVGNSSK